MISRRVIQTLLGFVWFVDGVLQLKPQMFTSAFLEQVVLPTGEGQPHWISAIVNWGAGLAGGHLALWNSAFAVVQVLIGIAMMVNFKTKTTIVASIAWSAIVWVFGEGFGQLLTGQASLLSGAPGAVLIYALIGGAIWPNGEAGGADWKKQGIRFAQLSLAVVFVLGTVLQLQHAYLTPNGLSQVIAAPWLVSAIGHDGTVVSVLIAVMEAALSVLMMFRLRLRVAAWASIVLCLACWWVGQSFGQVLDPLSTDFNSGLVMAILALCAYPQALSGTQSFGAESVDVVSGARSPRFH